MSTNIPEGSSNSLLSSLLPKPKHSKPLVEPLKNASIVPVSETSSSNVISQNNLLAKRMIIPIEKDNLGNIKYDVLAKLGQPEGRIVQASLQDALPIVEQSSLKRQPGLAPFYPMPDDSLIKRCIEETRAYLDALINTGPLGRPKVNPHTQFLQLKGPNDTTRLVRLTEAPVDPLEPPKFHHKKAPRPPPSPPAPVLHSPPRKPTQAAYNAWKVPPCVSSWKNPKGYTIPLDKRMINNPKDLEPIEINPAFADVSQALYVAEKASREQLELRLALEKEKEAKEAAQKEIKLKQMSEQSRKQKFRPMSDQLSFKGKKYDDDEGHRDGDDALFDPSLFRDDHLQAEGEKTYDLASGLIDDESSSAVIIDKPLFSKASGRGITSYHKVTVDDDVYGKGTSDLSKLLKKAEEIARTNVGDNNPLYPSFSEAKGKNKGHIGDEAEEGGFDVNRFLEKKVEFAEPISMSALDQRLQQQYDQKVQAASKYMAKPEPADVGDESDVFGLNNFLTSARNASKRSRY
jgi:hypothetical protein